MSKEILLTNIDLCAGCNKCIAKCPVKANVALQYNEENKIKVDQHRCIHCGECISVCDHNVRDFADDTDRFFFDLKQGTTISVIAAPSTRFIFPAYKRLYGYLKSLGVNLIHDVAMGADITVWAYLKIIAEQNSASIIAPPCPTIVNYIQKYRPEIIENLAPIHSPMMCTAIYLRNYKEVTEPLAFLSPCIGKIDEINDKEAHGIIKYNVTFKKLEQYLINNNIDLNNYQETDYAAVGQGIGLTLSRPGGLRENVEFYTNSAWIRQLEGSPYVYNYIDEYARQVRANKPLPLILDLLNCHHGCNLGTGTTKSLLVDDIDCQINKLKQEKIADFKKQYPGKESVTLFDFFNNNLNLKDFMRQYVDKSLTSTDVLDLELEPIFLQLHKTTPASRNINCYTCGYGSCKEFAKAVANGANHVSNCIDYNRKELITKKEDLYQTNKEVEQLHHLATHDFLTNIPNRYYLEGYLKKLTASLATESAIQTESALLFIDLDNFKVVNDSFGHSTGDKILISVVARLQEALSREAILARLGGDEFAVVLKNTGLDQAKAVANHLLQALRKEEFIIATTQQIIGFPITASIGVTLIDGTLDPEKLFSYADVALYTAKEEGKNRTIIVQTGDDKARLSESNRIILQIKNALQEDKFSLLFQPIFNTTGFIVHYESLLRMVDANNKLISPIDFLPIAERFGIISQIDKWVLNKAIETLHRYPAISLFVNVSASSLGDEELLKHIEVKIADSNLLPSRIGFEITETAAIRDIAQAENWICRLKSLGCKFALDDFGVGFSSFTHLQNLPVDYLKIDGSFIKNIDVNPTHKALVQAMSSVAHALDKKTIAEYVETENIWQILRELKIDCGQGYYLGKPSPLPQP